MKQDKIALVRPRYGFPTPSLPFYHIGFDTEIDGDFRGQVKLTAVKVNGSLTRDFYVYNAGRPSPEGRADFSRPVRVVVRADWRNGSQNTVEACFLDLDGAHCDATHSSIAPEWGGYWNADWSYYSASILKEEKGLDRTQEPVHLLLAYYAERLTDPQREIRVVEIDPLSGASRELPSQVYGVQTADSLKTVESQPTTTLEVAFLADVPALSSKVFLVFYGNPKAERPNYKTDLAVSGSGLDMTVENAFYRAKTHAKSGQLDEFLLKQGIDVVFDHKIETNGALHWNPDLYAPPRVWTHASDWAPPANCAIENGPIFFMTKRWGALPDYPDALCAITYVFYTHQPYMLMDSVIDILEPMDVRALRNGEIVINLNVADSFSWKEPNGAVRNVRFEDRPKEPRRALDIPERSPWWAFTNLERQAALASIVLENTSTLRAGGLTRAEPYITLKWGPWVYCTKPLAYTFNSSNPQRLIHVPAGSSFAERAAFAPLRLGEGTGRFDVVERLSEKLHAPLSVSEPWMEVDMRVPEPWGSNFPYPCPEEAE